MSLLDLKTDLKSLKYGSDRPGGGNSGQPYQQVDINKVDSGFNQFRMTNFDDGLVRGGVVGATNASVVDTFRIGKFLKDFPKGPLFIVKQVGLQLSNPQLEHKTNFPTNKPTREQGLLGNIGNFISNTANKILNAVGPTRIYNLGINTLAQVPVNAFGQHIVRHGFTPRRDKDNLYFNIVYNNNKEYNNNRLVQLTSILGTQDNIADYVGGPGSVYGIGKTLIRRRGDYIIVNQDTTESEWALTGSLNLSNAKQKNSFIGASNKMRNEPKSFTGVSQYSSSVFSTTRFSNLTSTTDPLYKPRTLDNYTASINDTSSINTISKWNGSLTASNDLGVSKQYFSGSEIPLPLNNTTYGGTQSSNIELAKGSNTPPLVSNIKNESYSTYKRIIDSKQLRKDLYTVNGKTANEFGIYGGDEKLVRNSVYYTDDIQPTSLNYPIYTNGTDIIKINIPWNEVSREQRVGSGKKDILNLTPIFEAPAGSRSDEAPLTIPGTNTKNINDLVKFRIQSLIGNDPTQAKWMIFRAYLTQFSDGTDASWNEIQYVGRGDKFYIYNGFSRKINIGFKVAALSAQEMEPMYQKLNYLIGNLMPDYTEDGLMRGPIVRMTVGNWIDGQVGILNNVSYTIPQDSPWEIAINEPITGEQLLVLPHIVEVSMTFTPIGSQTKGENKISSKDLKTSHIAQNVNDYQYIK